MVPATSNMPIKLYELYTLQRDETIKLRRMYMSITVYPKIIRDSISNYSENYRLYYICMSNTKKIPKKFGGLYLAPPLHLELNDKYIMISHHLKNISEKTSSS